MNNHKDNHRHHGATANKRSMSDTDEEFHSSHPSPLQHVEFPSSPSKPNQFPSDPSKAIVAVDNYGASFRSNSNHQIPPHIAYNRTTMEDPVTGVSRVNPSRVEAGNGGAGGERRPAPAQSRRPKREVMVDRATLGFRVLEVVLSLIAFSVMASDKTQGWSGDSFDRYKEYRYLVAVNAIAFAYAAFQAIDTTYHLINGKHIISYSLRPHFDFLIDQVLAYLLISASSSAATRVDDWVSNWGKDDFTEMATASIGMSFLAFLAFALSSLISGYNLCNYNSL